MWAIDLCERLETQWRVKPFKEKNTIWNIRIWYFRYEIFVGDISERMADFERKFSTRCIALAKTENGTKRSKGMRGVLVAVAYKYRDLHGKICISKGYDSPSLHALPLSSLISSLSSPFFDSVIFFSASYHRIFLSSLF